MKGFWRALFGASIGDTSQGRSKRIMRPVDGYEALNAKIKNETENFDRSKESGWLWKRNSSVDRRPSPTGTATGRDGVSTRAAL